MSTVPGNPNGAPEISAEPRRELEIDKLFRMVMKHQGSDLHIKAGLPPLMRLRGAKVQPSYRIQDAPQLIRLA